MLSVDSEVTMAKELILGLVWQLPDSLDSGKLEEKLKAFIQDDGILEVSPPHNLGIPANRARLDSYTLRDATLGVIALTSVMRGTIVK
jgi:hypothetical protein